MCNINKKKCELCGREISLSNYKRHIEKCNGMEKKSKNDLPNIEIKEENKVTYKQQSVIDMICDNLEINCPPNLTKSSLNFFNVS